MAKNEIDGNTRIYFSIIQQMRVDYIQNSLSLRELAKKYHLSFGTVQKISVEYKFKESRISFQEKMLQKSLDRMVTTQAAILNRVTTILDNQTKRLLKQQEKDPDKIIDPNRMKEVLTAFSLLAKEYRLDQGKATDNHVHKIVVEMGSSIPVITDNHLVNADKPDVEVEVNPVVETVIEQPPQESEQVEVVVEGEQEPPLFGSISE